MEEVVLIAEKREVIGKKVKVLRRSGELPAILYGHHITPLPILLNHRDANRILPEISSSHLVIVDVEGEKHTTLVRAKQRHPVTGELQHVDFMAVSLTEKLRAKVVLELVGDSPAVQELGGILVTGQEDIEVECLPKDLPERITVDLSCLVKIGDALHVRDLVVPASVNVLSNVEDMVVLITMPAVEVVEEEEEEKIVEGEPEVIEKGKKEEETVEE